MLSEIWISLRFPQNFDLKLLENVTFSSSFEPPSNINSIELKKTPLNEELSCKNCENLLDFRVTVISIKNDEDLIKNVEGPEFVIKTEDDVSFEVFEPELNIQENFEDITKICSDEDEEKRPKIDIELDKIYKEFKEKKHKTFPFFAKTTTIEGLKLYFFQQKKRHVFYMMNFDPQACQCDICPMKGFKTIPAVLNHRRYHFYETGDNQCGVCKVKLENEKLFNHTLMCPKKWEIKPLTCKFCQKIFSKFTLQRMHENGCKDGSHKKICHLCPMSFEETSALNAHLRKFHEINPFRCDHCPRFFGSLPDVRTHLIQKHFPQLGQFPCPDCHKNFPLKKRLDHHWKLIHGASTTPLKCKHCEKSFKTPPGLKFHMANVHTDFHNRTKFYCHVCGKVFFAKYTLQAHARTHLEPEFECKRCSKKFRNKYKWAEHEKTHLEGPKNVCSFCGKGFSSKQYLSNHVYLHTGQKPYECQVCQKRFSDRGNLRSHLKNHEKTMGVKLVLNPEERRLVKQRMVAPELILEQQD